MSTSCYVPGCQRPREQEDCCTPHSLATYREVCGHLIKNNPSRPCIRSAGHAGGAHHDAAQYQRRLDREAAARRSARQGRYDNDRMIPNDGVIDWTAIEITLEGLRQVRLTWVEREIAAAIMLARGETRDDVEERMGLNLSSSSAGRLQVQRVMDMADYIREHGYEPQQ